MIEFTIKTLESNNHQFSVEDDTTVAQVKELILQEMGIAVDMQRLIFCGRVLTDDRRLSEFDVNGKVIHLVARPPPSSQNRNQTSSSPGIGRQELRDALEEAQRVIDRMANQPGNASNNNRLGPMMRRHIWSQDPPSDLVMDQHQTLMMTPTANRLEFVRRILDDIRHALATLHTHMFHENSDEAASPPAEPMDTETSTPTDSPSKPLPTETTGTRSEPEEIHQTAMTERAAAAVVGVPTLTTQRRRPPRPRRPVLTRLLDLAELIEEVEILQTEFAPFRRFYTRLLRDNYIAQLLPDQRRRRQSIIELVCDIMHSFSHAYHALSDINVVIGERYPRLTTGFTTNRNAIPLNQGNRHPFGRLYNDSRPTNTRQNDARRTDARPNDARPTNARPTNARPNDARPTNARRTDAQNVNMGNLRIAPPRPPCLLTASIPFPIPNRAPSDNSSSGGTASTTGAPTPMATGASTGATAGTIPPASAANIGAPITGTGTNTQAGFTNPEGVTYQVEIETRVPIALPIDPALLTGLAAVATNLQQGQNRQSQPNVGTQQGATQEQSTGARPGQPQNQSQAQSQDQPDGQGNRPRVLMDIENLMRTLSQAHPGVEVVMTMEEISELNMGNGQPGAAPGANEQSARVDVPFLGIPGMRGGTFNGRPTGTEGPDFGEMNVGIGINLGPTPGPNNTGATTGGTTGAAPDASSGGGFPGGQFVDTPFGQFQIPVIEGVPFSGEATFNLGPDGNTTMNPGAGQPLFRPDIFGINPDDLPEGGVFLGPITTGGPESSEFFQNIIANMLRQQMNSPTEGAHNTTNPATTHTATSNTGTTHTVTSNPGTTHTVTSNDGKSHTVTSNTGRTHTVTSNTSTTHTATSNMGTARTGTRTTGVTHTGAKNTASGNTAPTNTGANNTGAPNAGTRRPRNASGASTNTGSIPQATFTYTPLNPVPISIGGSGLPSETAWAVDLTPPNVLHFENLLAGSGQGQQTGQDRLGPLSAIARARTLQQAEQRRRNANQSAGIGPERHRQSSARAHHLAMACMAYDRFLPCDSVHARTRLTERRSAYQQRHNDQMRQRNSRRAAYEIDHLTDRNIHFTTRHMAIMMRLLSGPISMEGRFNAFMATVARTLYMTPDEDTPSARESIRMPREYLFVRMQMRDYIQRLVDSVRTHNYGGRRPFDVVGTLILAENADFLNRMNEYTPINANAEPITALRNFLSRRMPSIIACVLSDSTSDQLMTRFFAVFAKFYRDLCELVLEFCADGFDGLRVLYTAFIEHVTGSFESSSREWIRLLSRENLMAVQNTIDPRRASTYNPIFRYDGSTRSRDCCVYRYALRPENCRLSQVRLNQLPHICMRHQRLSMPMTMPTMRPSQRVGPSDDIDSSPSSSIPSMSSSSDESESPLPPEQDNDEQESEENSRENQSGSPPLEDDNDANVVENASNDSENSTTRSSPVEMRSATASPRQDSPETVDQNGDTTEAASQPLPDDRSQTSSSRSSPDSMRFVPPVMLLEHWGEEWVPVFTRDQRTQRERERPQEPHSDAYLSGMPSRKRRCVRASRPPTTLDGFMNESVREATESPANLNPTQIRTVLRDSVRSLVRTRAETSEDFDPARYTAAARFLDQAKQTNDETENKSE